VKTRGLGRVYARGRAWWVQYSFRGRVYRESVGTWIEETTGEGRTRRRPTTRADALRRLRTRQAEMGTGRLVGPDIERTTFEDLARMLVADYTVNGRKSLETAQGSLKALRAVFGPAYARDITLDRLNAYVAARLEAGRKPATIQKELAALKRAFHLAARAGKAIAPPFPRLRVSNTRTGFFEEPEFRAVHAGLSGDLQPVIEFLYLTGWRLTEVLTLEWRQVDVAAGVVRLEPGTTKNDEGREFPFSVLPPLEACLRRQRERTTAIERETGQIIRRVFHRQGAPVRDLRGAWKTACLAAGFFRVVPVLDLGGHPRVATDGTPLGVTQATKLVHDFRRTAVRNLERAGVPRSVAMKLTGHQTESVYRRYAIVAAADLVEGVKKLATLHATEAALPRTVLPFPGRSSTELAHSGAAG
jgi:integrase